MAEPTGYTPGLIPMPFTRTVLATLAAAATVAAAAPAVTAAPPVQALSGTGISRLPDDVRRLTVSARTGSDGTSDGRVSFSHDNDPNGVSQFRGTVSCLVVDGATARFTGTVTSGETASGVVLTGRQFAFTVELEGPQAFSLPRFADTVEPCSGGRPQTVLVDDGRFRDR